MSAGRTPPPGAPDDAGHSWAEILSRLTRGSDLSAAQVSWAMQEILTGEATPVQIAGFAVGLRTKGESVAELSGLVDTMYAHARVLDLPGRWLDVVGTGGDRSMSVNISTMAALVAAGAGARVAKHGNRSASSQAGAADVLEALGVRLDLSPAQVAAVAAEAGITFCFAPAFHPALRHAALPRRELAIATVFNFLGPLANPARPAAQAIGCADARMAPLMAGVFATRGVSSWVFRGDDGLDELTTTTTSQVWAVAEGRVTHFEVDPRRLGIPAATAADLRGGDVHANAQVVRDLLDGAHGPVRDAVVLNAGAALAVYGGATDHLLDALAHGVGQAAESLDTGAARAVLDRWVRTTAAVGGAQG